MYFKYKWSCICILHFCKLKYFFKILFKLSYVPGSGRNVTKLIFFTVTITLLNGSSSNGDFSCEYLLWTVVLMFNMND